jgi:hypothetical protein
MAFVSALSDFFSCGRSRRAREPALDPNDTTSEPTAHETAASALALAPIDEKTTFEVDIRAQPEGNASCIANTQQPDVRPTSTNRYHDSAEDKEMEMVVVQEKAKPSAGWVVEQRVLVTSMPSVTKEAENTTSVPEPEPETTTVTPPVRCATPEQEPWNSTPVARSATPEPEASSASPIVRPVTPEAEPADVASIRSATPEIEPVVQQPIMSEPEEISLPASDEIVASIPETEIIVGQAPAVKRTTPVTFLNMPPGTFMSWFGHVKHANSTQRSATRFTSI